MSDKISIVVPVYNVEKYIGRCIESILSQTYSNIELILVDDGSPDNSGKICDDYAKKDKRITVVHQQNKGVSIARNNGIKNATGKYISFVDADDWLDETYAEDMLNAIKISDSDVCICNYKRIIGDSILVCENNLTDLSTDNSINHLCDYNEYGLSACNKLYKVKAINGIFFPENIKNMEDFLFNIRVWGNIDSVVYIKKALYNYYYHSDSASNSFKLPNSFSTYKIVCNKLHKYNSVYENDYKLNYIFDYYCRKALDKNFDDDEIRKWLKEIFNISTFLKHGSFVLKIKIIITAFFPKVYIYRKRKLIASSNLDV